MYAYEARLKLMIHGHYDGGSEQDNVLDKRLPIG
jgi:hypothetical protein